MRIIKKGQRFQILRNELNKAANLGYTTEIFQGEMAIDVLDRFYLTEGGRNWREVSNFRIGKHDCELFVCVGFNSDKEIIGVNATLVSKSYAYTFFYCGIVKQNIRWLITERLIEYLYRIDISLLHTDNLLDVSTGSYIFQKAMGYKTVRLVFK
jgi:hypothetical protein